MMHDNFGRAIKNLRISVTRRCNLNCIYCHKEGDDTIHDTEMSPDEIARITKICSNFGIMKVKITGGEPFVRKDIFEIIKGISGICGIEDVSLTTNATLDVNWDKLRDSGLSRINISIDSLDGVRYGKITNSVNDVEKVLSNIKNAANAFPLVKLNMVVLKGINDSEIQNMIEFSSKHGIVLQLIELIGNNKFFKKYFYDLSAVEKVLSENANEIVIREMHNRKKYILDTGEVEVIRPMHNTEFCMNCNRMRISADGKFKPCLMRNDNLVDFLTKMRDNASDSELGELFKAAVGKREPYFSF